jgi:SAM-dependent methyltransferase
MNKYRLIRCALCNEEKGRTLVATNDPYLNRKDLFEVIECQKCGLVRTRNLPFPDDLSTWYNQHYGWYNQHYGRVHTGSSKDIPAPLSNPSPSLLKKWVLGPLEKILRTDYAQFATSRISPQGRILEVGCGAGHILLVLKKQGADVQGIEPHSGLAETARQRGLVIHNSHFEDWNGFSTPFDQIIFSFTLEQIEDPVNALSLARKYLAPGGAITILCPNLNSITRFLFRKNWMMWHVPYHKYYFSQKTIKRVLDQVGLKVVSLKTDWRMDAEMESVRIAWNRACRKQVIPFPSQPKKLILLALGLIFLPFKWIRMGNMLYVVATPK